MVKVYALIGVGQKDSARVLVEKLAADNPTIARYRALADSLK
jgi:hypothetical protein